MTRGRQLDELKRMIAAFEHHRNRLAAISRNLRRHAENLTLEARPKRRFNGRHKGTWTGADERFYLDRFFELEAQSDVEILTLKRKLERQRNAISARIEKLGLNDQPQLNDIPKIHPGVWLPRR